VSAGEWGMLAVALALMGAGMWWGLRVADSWTARERDRRDAARYLAAKHRHPSGRRWAP
jgi:hypothetical protein